MGHAANHVGNGRILVANKATAVGTVGVDEEPAFKVLQVASVESTKTYAAVRGDFFSFGEVARGGAALRGQLQGLDDPAPRAEPGAGGRADGPPGELQNADQNLELRARARSTACSSTSAERRASTSSRC